MRGTNLLLANFPHTAQNASFRAVGADDVMNIVHGFGAQVTIREVIPQVASDVLASVLVHDKIFVPLLNVIDVIRAFGVADTVKLLKSGCLEIIADDGLNAVLKQRQDTYEVGFVVDMPRTSPGVLDVGRFGRKLKELLGGDTAQCGAVIQAVDAVTCRLPSPETVEAKILAELKYDLANANCVERFGLTTHDIKFVAPRDAYPMLRMLYVNKALVFAALLNIPSLRIESGCKRLLESKLSPALANKCGNNSVQVFKEVIALKGIPDLSELYLHKVITLEDCLDLRDNLDGRAFRDWIAECQYDRERIVKKLLSPKISPGVLEKGIRWIIPKAVKFTDGLAGALMGVGSSYLIDRFLSDWHPNFYLDGKLATTIDGKIEQHQASVQRDTIARRFGKIGRNEACPCGSGKKFKRCCGA